MKLFFKRPSRIWLVILSEFFVNIGAGWFGIVLFDPFVSPMATIWDAIALTLKIIFGILSLIAAKILREEISRKWK